MPQEQRLWDQINELQSQADQARRNGLYLEAIALLDKAIETGSEAGLDMFIMSILRETYRAESGQSTQADMIALHRQATARFREQENLVELLESLINLAQLLINKEQRDAAHECLIEAEALIESLKSTDMDRIGQSFPDEYPRSPEQFLQLRAVVLARLQQQLK